MHKRREFKTAFGLVPKPIVRGDYLVGHKVIGLDQVDGRSIGLEHMSEEFDGLTPQVLASIPGQVWISLRIDFYDVEFIETQPFGDKAIRERFGPPIGKQAIDLVVQSRAQLTFSG